MKDNKDHKCTFWQGPRYFLTKRMNSYIQSVIVTTAFCVLAAPQRDRQGTAVSSGLILDSFRATWHRTSTFTHDQMVFTYYSKQLGKKVLKYARYRN